MCIFLPSFVLTNPVWNVADRQVPSLTIYLGPKTNKHLLFYCMIFFGDPSARPSCAFQSLPADSAGADVIDDALEYDFESEASQQI